MLELTKFVAATMWLAGFLYYPLWVFALLLTLAVVSRERQKRHEELLAAMQQQSTS